MSTTEWQKCYSTDDEEYALAELAESPASLEAQRGAVISGLAAIDRLMPELSTGALAAGALQLDQLLASTAGMGTADIRRALGMT